MKFFKSIISVFLFLVLTNCSGGGRDLSGGGNYCNLNSLANFGNKPEGAKLIDSFSADEKEDGIKEIITSENLGVGQFDLKSMDFMYVEVVEPKKRRSWIMTQIRSEAVQLSKLRTKEKAEGKVNGEDVVYRTRQYCAGGYQLHTPSYSAEMTGISKVNVYSEARLEWQLQSLGYQWNREKLTLEPLYIETDKDGKEKYSWSKPEDSGKYQAPKDVFGESVEEMKLFKLKGGKSFQLLTKIKVKDNVYHLMRSTFVKKDEE